MVSLCGWCPSIKIGNEWFRIESELHQKLPEHIVVTHGCCPACLQRVTGNIPVVNKEDQEFVTSFLTRQ